uniref:PDZ domain-containing protein n=1 Tax=Eiseniibacteriota bacterium TaxID=2212470 RepID=A0A832I0Q2_UNCEI
MSRRAAVALAFALGLAAGGVAAWGAAPRGSRPAPAPATPAAADRTAQISASRRTAIVSAAQRVSPAVVSVSVIQTRVVRTDPFGGIFRDEFFDRFYPPMEYREQVPGIGSGVIVDRRGHVLTNEHVVRNAQEITVTLGDGRQLPATLLGASAVYDLAVLRVEGDDLPVAPLGDSDGLVVGEWAIAIGNPFGYLLNDPQPTVTAGVVSATRRDVKSEATEGGVYKNMIQTDAAINPGNSGGPLVNGDGEVIGINTFIFTRGGGSLGIGFAIPINLARRLLDEIVTYGRVRAAWPGMQVQEVTPYLARRLGFREAGGLVVTRVEEGGPAARAGVRAGDRVRAVNGTAVRNLDDAQRGIYGAAVGDRVTLELERGGRTLTLTLTLVEAPGGGR